MRSSLPDSIFPGVNEEQIEISGTAEGDPLEACFDEIDEPVDCGEIPDLGPIPDFQDEQSRFSDNVVMILPWLLGTLAALAIVSGTGLILWKRYMYSSEDPKRVFRRLAKLGKFSSIGPEDHQTPYQYKESLVTAMPKYKEEITALVDAYVRSEYGAKELPDSDLRSRLCRRSLISTPSLLCS